MATAELSKVESIEFADADGEQLKSSGHAEQLRVSVSGGNVGVDPEREVIQGVIVAEEGPFKSEGRGEFDAAAIKTIVSLGKKSVGGLKSRLDHPQPVGGVMGTFLGRLKSFRLDTVMRPDGAGAMVPRAVGRADLHIDPSSHVSPRGDIGLYALTLAKSDPEAAGMSLVVKADQFYRLDRNGRRKMGADGQELPPLWRPTELAAIDLVDVGEATNSMLGQYDSASALAAATAAFEALSTADQTAWLIARATPAPAALASTQTPATEEAKSESGPPADDGTSDRMALEIDMMQMEG